jgi:hypothetical protein
MFQFSAQSVEEEGKGEVMKKTLPRSYHIRVICPSSAYNHVGGTNNQNMYGLHIVHCFNDHCRDDHSFR